MAKVTSQQQRKLANHEIVTLAVYLIGGDSRSVDTEDIAVKADELAPGRFCWRKYKNQINIEIVRAFLSDAKKPKYRSLLTGAGNDGWMLTEAGLRFVHEHTSQVEHSDLARKRLSRRDQNWVRSERERMITSAAFSKFRERGVEAVSEQEAEAFFRIDSYVIGSAREQKLLRVKNTFGGDPELGEAVTVLALKIKKISAQHAV